MRPSTAVELRVGLLGGQLLLLDEARELALGHLTGLVETGLHERLVDVLQHDGDLRGGDDLGDLAAHRAGANHGGFEHEHCVSSLDLAGARRGLDRRRAPKSSAGAEAPGGSGARFRGNLPAVISLRPTFPLTVAAATVALAGLAPGAAQAAAPTVATGSATAVTFSSAVINGTVNPRGAQTSATFQYGPTPALAFDDTGDSARQRQGLDPLQLGPQRPEAGHAVLLPDRSHGRRRHVRRRPSSRSRRSRSRSRCRSPPRPIRSCSATRSSSRARSRGPATAATTSCCRRTRSRTRRAFRRSATRRSRARPAASSSRSSASSRRPSCASRRSTTRRS